jgi:DNA-binding protein HU-beta
MLKYELIEELALRCNITGSDSNRYLDTFINLIYEVLKEDGNVSIFGFGKFEVSHRRARIGVNPRNPSQKITIPKLNTPKFRAGEGFKKAVRQTK